MNGSATGWKVRDLRDEQAAKNDWAVASGWSGGDQLWHHLSQNTNMVRAVDALDWARFFPADRQATVLDLGCGAGWLSAKLSRQPGVGRVIAWDSSPFLVSESLPEMTRLLGGDVTKIEPVCADFLPLLIADASVDLVVMSSAFHHAPDPLALLGELARVTAPQGGVVLLNETPWHPVTMLSFATRTYLSTVWNMVRGWHPSEGHLGSFHALYDETLGDRAYTLRTWGRMFRETGWQMELLDSGMKSYPRHQRQAFRFEANLTHFVLRR